MLYKQKHIYGSSRVGMDVAEKDMITPTITEQSFYRESGKKQYELSNHLGNVLTVITDKKLPVESTTTTGTVDYFVVEILSASDYSAFGVLLQNREFTSAKYRYGFGSHEKDDEIKGSGNHYSFADYGYDPRLGRRWNIDPQWRNYPDQSPYATFNGNPILYEDPSGESGEVSINKRTKTVKVTSKLILYGGEANTKLAKSTARDIQNHWNAANGKVMIDGVEYNVKFKVKGSYKKNLTSDKVSKNTNIKNNYIRVEEGNARNISYMDGVGSNTGYFLLKNIQAEGSTTEAHEWGHGFGLVPGTPDGHPKE